MQNIDINVCGKFHDDRSRNDRALRDGKSDNNKINKNNVRTWPLWGVGTKSKKPISFYNPIQSNIRLI